MARRLEGKTALVTGATSNIGRAIAEAFAAEGAHVVISGRSAQRGAQIVESIRSRGDRADFVIAELDGSAEASRSLAEQATSVLGGRIDILVNNAGIYPGDSTAATDEKTFDRVYAVNVKAPFFLTAAIAPAMAAAGRGAIINLGSWIARLGIPRGALYSSTKGALETLTRAWAAEYGPHGVRVNAISPGVVQTPVPGEVHPGEVMMKGSPAGRPGSPEAIAPAAVYLASDEAAFVHGIVLDVDGGRTTTAVIAGNTRTVNATGTGFARHLPGPAPPNGEEGARPDLIEDLPDGGLRIERWHGPGSPPRRGRSRTGTNSLPLGSRMCRRRSSSPVPLFVSFPAKQTFELSPISAAYLPSFICPT